MKPKFARPQKIQNIQREKNAGGFTVIELVVYMAIFSVVSVFAIGTLLSSMKNFAQLRASQNLLSSARVSMERMAYEIKRAKSVDTAASVLGTNDGKLVLNTTDSDGNDTTVSFFLQNGALQISQNGSDEGALTRNDADVSELSFRHISTKHAEGVKMELTLESKSDASTTEHFEDTIILRNEKE